MTIDTLERSYLSPTSKGIQEENSGFKFSDQRVTSPSGRSTIKVEESYSPSPASPLNYQPLRASRNSGEKN